MKENKEVFRLTSEYDKLSDEKKKEVLDDIETWVDKEKVDIDFKVDSTTITIKNFKIKGNKDLKRWRRFYWLMNTIIKICIRKGHFIIIYKDGYIEDCCLNRKYGFDKVIVNNQEMIDKIENS